MKSLVFQGSHEEAMETESQTQPALWESGLKVPEKWGETIHQIPKIPGSCKIQEKKIQGSWPMTDIDRRKPGLVLISWESLSERFPQPLALFFMPCLTALLHLYFGGSSYGPNYQILKDLQHLSRILFLLFLFFDHSMKRLDVGSQFPYQRLNSGCHGESTKS